jgi:glutamate synthase domain-containing protein 3
VLGETGRNFAAGMSGGYAYVLDLAGEFAQRCNPAMVDLEPLAEQDDEARVKRLVESHARYTGSKRAAEILADWAKYRAKFVKVFPKEYRRALAELSQKKVAA